MSLSREHDFGETLAELAGYASLQGEPFPRTLKWQTLAQGILRITHPKDQQPIIKFDADDILPDGYDDQLDLADDMLNELYQRGILSIWNEFHPSPEGAYITTRYSLAPNPLDTDMLVPYAQRQTYLEELAQNGDLTPPPLPQQ